MKDAIVQTWFLQHSPEQVWECLTNPDLIEKWLMKNDFKAEVGHQFQFNAEPKVKIGFDGIVYCEVLEVIPLKKLSYSWKGGPGKGKITLNSVVTWTLTAKDNGTELLLEHRGFQGIKNYFAYFAMGKGWETKIRKRFVELLKHAQDETTTH